MKSYFCFYITMALVCPGFSGKIGSLYSEEYSDFSNDETEMTGFFQKPFPMQLKQCPKNMILYPGPGLRGPWICGCKPTFLYLSLDNSCHEVFRQGPCPPSHYVHVAVDEHVPRCTRNPCFMDGVVPYKGNCYPLQPKAACSDDGFLYVNERTYQLDCISNNRGSSWAHVVIKAPTTECPPGSHKNRAGYCKPENP